MQNTLKTDFRSRADCVLSSPAMISGLNSPNAAGFNFVTGVHQARSQPAATNASKTPPEERTRTEAAPLEDDDPFRIVREFSLLELAARGFERILPELEQLTIPVE